MKKANNKSIFVLPHLSLLLCVSQPDQLQLQQQQKKGDEIVITTECRRDDIRKNRMIII